MDLFLQMYMKKHLWKFQTTWNICIDSCLNSISHSYSLQLVFLASNETLWMVRWSVCGQSFASPDIKEDAQVVS